MDINKPRVPLRDAKEMTRHEYFCQKIPRVLIAFYPKLKRLPYNVLHHVVPHASARILGKTMGRV